MYGYHGKRIIDFLRITMAMPRLIAPAKRLLELGFKFGPFPSQSYQPYEANIDFEIRYVSTNSADISVYGKTCGVFRLIKENRNGAMHERCLWYIMCINHSE